MATYNKADHDAAIPARLEAVAFLASKGYTIKAIGYAFHKTPDWARAKLAKHKYQQDRKKSGLTAV